MVGCCISVRTAKIKIKQNDEATEMATEFMHIFL